MPPGCLIALAVGIVPAIGVEHAPDRPFTVLFFAQFFRDQSGKPFLETHIVLHGPIVLHQDVWGNGTFYLKKTLET